MKYINIENLGMIIFPDRIDHRDMFDVISNGFNKPNLKSAGKIMADGEIVPGMVTCYGESITLSCRCNKTDDNDELKKMFDIY